MHSSSLSLTDVFPWKEKVDNQTVLVSESSLEGRFTVYAAAAQHKPVFWCSAAPFVAPMLENGLQKMGIKVESSSVFRYLMAELVAEIEKGDVDYEAYLKQIIKDAGDWMSENPGGSIFLDDVSSLAQVAGPRLAYIWVRSMQSKTDSCWIRASPRPTEHKPSSPWLIGDEETPSWEESLVECADVTVDVVPLVSGASRESHGRLVVGHRGAFTSYTFCLTDTKALVTKTLSMSERGMP